MNMNQFTQKSLEAVQSAQTIAQEYGNQQIEQAHFLYALLEQENGLIPQLLGNMGITFPSFEAAARKLVEEFLAEAVQPVLEKYADVLGEKETELKV